MAAQKILRKELRQARKGQPGGTGRKHIGVVRWNYQGWKCEVKENDGLFFWMVRPATTEMEKALPVFRDRTLVSVKGLGGEDSLAEAQQACKDAVEERTEL